MNAWISKKINGHGGAYFSKGYNGRARIIYIGHKNKLQVLWYNFILFCYNLIKQGRIKGA